MRAMPTGMPLLASTMHALARIRAIPGVKSAAVTLSLPYERPLNYGYKQLDGFCGPPPRRHR